MIRINLLGQERPRKGARRVGPAVPAGMGFLMAVMGGAVLLGLGALTVLWNTVKADRDQAVEQVEKLKREKNELTTLKQDVDKFQVQKAVLEQRIMVIKELERNRTGGQELLDMIATTVTRTEQMWLTGLTRKGNSLTIDGTAASIAAVANYITQLQRSGYFEKVEIKETKQDDENVAVVTFWFILKADIVQPKISEAPAAAQKKS